jgi:competence protein ComFC
MDVSLRPIEGPWTAGYVLDRTLLASAYLGEDPAGRPRVTTTRTEVGEALFQLKHRGDLSKAEPLARALRLRVLPRLGPIGFIVPMPPSRARPWQPVALVARALGQQLRVPVFERLLLKTPQASAARACATREETLGWLVATFSLHDEIRNPGRWNALLIDDHIDTGVTLEAASRVLCQYPKVAQLYVAVLTS